MVQLPPLALLVQQVALMALTANPRGYCSTPLLADPAWRRRTHAAHLGLDALPVMFLPVGPGGLPGGLRREGRAGASTPGRGEVRLHAHLLGLNAPGWTFVWHSQGGHTTQLPRTPSPRPALQTRPAGARGRRASS